MLKFDAGIPVDPVEFWLYGAKVTRSSADKWAARKARGKAQISAAGAAKGKAQISGEAGSGKSTKLRRYGKARIVDGGRRGAAPVVVGGRPSPHLARYGSIRKFGLRGLLPNQIRPEGQPLP